MNTYRGIKPTYEVAPSLWCARSVILACSQLKSQRTWFRMVGRTFYLFLSILFPVPSNGMAVDMEVRNVTRIPEGLEDMGLVCRGACAYFGDLDIGEVLAWKCPKMDFETGTTGTVACLAFHRWLAGNSSADIKTRVVPLWSVGRPLRKFLLNASSHVWTRSRRDRWRPALEVFQVGSRPEWYFVLASSFLSKERTFLAINTFCIALRSFVSFTTSASPSSILQKCAHFNPETTSQLLFFERRVLAVRHFSSPSSSTSGALRLLTTAQVTHTSKESTPRHSCHNGPYIPKL